jgi:hypothetical protein
MEFGFVCQTAAKTIIDRGLPPLETKEKKLPSPRGNPILNCKNTALKMIIEKK